MSSDELVVLLEGRSIGRLRRTSAGQLSLAYDDPYLLDRSATPLSVALPAADQRHGDAVVRAWLWGLLPDNADVIQRWATRFGVSASSPFGLLGTQIGHDCAGAVQFAHPADVEALQHRPGEITWLGTDDLEARLRALRTDSTSWLGQGFTGQFSLGGAQAKLALAHRDGQWGEPSGSTPTTHILKPAIPGLAGHDLNEHLCLGAAAEVGMLAARSTIAEFGHERAIAVERYDRALVGGQLIRIHQEDMCQALGLHPSRKYQAEGGPSAEDIVRLLRRIMPAAEAHAATVRFVDALIFNWIVAGTDAHAKNYSLLLAGRQIRLAPMYDVASALPYDTSKGFDLALAMKLGGDYKLRSHRRSTWPKVAAAAGLPTDLVVDRVRDLTISLPEAFERIAIRPSIAALESELPAVLAKLVAARAASCRLVLG